MIDTDKYEGHTKGDNEIGWRIVGDGFVMNGTAPADRYIGYIRHSNFKPDIPAEIQLFSDADAQLIADAPLLLQEIKRLRELLSLRELFSLDEGSRDEGYCVTMRLEGCEYIGTLRLYKDEEGKVSE